MFFTVQMSPNFPRKTDLRQSLLGQKGSGDCEIMLFKFPHPGYLYSLLWCDIRIPSEDNTHSGVSINHSSRALDLSPTYQDTINTDRAPGDQHMSSFRRPLSWLQNYFKYDFPLQNSKLVKMSMTDWGEICQIVNPDQHG